MALRDDLGRRMKEFYENPAKTKLLRRTPVAIRIDGKAFHTFTKGFVRPFDDVLHETMCLTTEYLCNNIQGCVLGYTQSDEITLILVDYKHLNSSAWFDNEVQKLCSVSASMATMAFNKFFGMAVFEWYSKAPNTYDNAVLFEKYEAKIGSAMFDARAFNIPREEVTNLIYWRQLDAIRNSVQLVGQTHFSHKQLQGKSCAQIKEMLLNEKGINWDDFPVLVKRGSCAIREEDSGQWVTDFDIPVFVGEGREYVEKLIQPEEE